MVNPQNFMVSEKSQTYIILWFHVYEKSSKGNTTETARRLVVTEDLLGVIEVFQNWILVMVAQFCKFAKNHKSLNCTLNPGEINHT